MNYIFKTILCFSFLLTVNASFANEVKIVDVVVKKTSQNTFVFAVTLKHDDDGWGHYANEWQILGPDGDILGSRILAHPHDQEQPFTRNLGSVYIPPAITEVTIRAQDSVHGWSPETLATDVPH